MQTRTLYIRTVPSQPPRVPHKSIQHNNKIKKFRENIKKSSTIHDISKRLSLNNFNPQTSSNEKVSDQHSQILEQQSQGMTEFEEKYELLQQLGGSSKMTRYRCQQKKTGQFYAVKMFSFEWEEVNNLKQNFITVKELNHSNIIQYKALYLNTSRRKCYLVIELITAPPLEQITINSEIELKIIMFQLMDTLAYLHSNHLAHRNIKGTSILYDPLTNKIKLAGFVHAKKVIQRGAKTEMLTITDNILYMAPQMLEGGGYDQTVDVWAAGIVLYKMITGRTPFEEEYRSETIERIRNSEVAFSQQFQKYSPQLKLILIKMLDKKPYRRVSANECLDQLWLSSATFERPSTLKRSGFISFFEQSV